MARLRLEFRKTGSIRYTSHRDLIKIFQRAFAVSRLPVCYSRGFHPRPRVSFGPPLKTGWEGLGECLDIELERYVAGVAEALNRALPDGLRIVQAVPVDKGVPKLSADVCAARYAVGVDADTFWRGCGESIGFPHPRSETSRRGAERHSKSEALKKLEAGIWHRFSAEAIDPSRASEEPSLRELTVLEEDGSVILEYVCTMPSGRSLLPNDLLSPFLGDPAEFGIPFKVVRKALYVKRNEALLSPTSKGVVQRLS